MSRASTRSEAGGIAAALSLAGGRALVALLLLGAAAGALTLAEGARLRAELVRLERARGIEAALGDVGEAVDVLGQRL
ncbi:MAG TPA: hypothetical protein VI078_17340, partial [bacterium]